MQGVMLQQPWKKLLMGGGGGGILYIPDLSNMQERKQTNKKGERT